MFLNYSPQKMRRIAIIIIASWFIRRKKRMIFHISLKNNPSAFIIAVPFPFHFPTQKLPL
jgi:hypothetical protein